MNGVLVVNKEKNYTSRDIVNIISKTLKTKKVGHTGTLDPLATGVLVVTVGEATKISELLTSSSKEYIVDVELGIETDTLDITGNIIYKEDISKLDINYIKEVLYSFIGESEQTVPIYSAIHVNGKRLYEYARNNIDIELPKRNIDIKDIELLSYKEDEIKFRCTVSKGTYIRSLIKDICNKLNVIGTMSDLIRTKQGNFTLEDSYTLEDILDLEIINCKEDLFKRVKNGVKLDSYSKYRLFIYNNERICLYNLDGKVLIMF